MYTEQIDDAIGRGLKSGDEVPASQGLLTVGAYKIVTVSEGARSERLCVVLESPLMTTFTICCLSPVLDRSRSAFLLCPLLHLFPQDGSLGARTAYCCAPYPQTTSHGILVHSALALSSLFSHGTSHGLKLAIHAIGDAANSLTLSSLAAMDPPPLAGSSIEHAQLVSEGEFEKFKEVGVVASIQPSHLLDDKELADRFWQGRTGRAFAYRLVVFFSSSPRWH